MGNSYVEPISKRPQFKEESAKKAITKLSEALLQLMREKAKALLDGESALFQQIAKKSLDKKQLVLDLFQNIKSRNEIKVLNGCKEAIPTLLANTNSISEAVKTQKYKSLENIKTAINSTIIVLISHESLRLPEVKSLVEELYGPEVWKRQPTSFDVAPDYKSLFDPIDSAKIKVHLELIMNKSGNKDPWAYGVLGVPPPVDLKNLPPADLLSTYQQVKEEESRFQVRSQTMPSQPTSDLAGFLDSIRSGEVQFRGQLNDLQYQQFIQKLREIGA